MPKTETEKSREYRRRKKDEMIKIKKTNKSSTEPVREFRTRQKYKLNNQNITTYMDKNVPSGQNNQKEACDHGLVFVEVQGLPLISEAQSVNSIQYRVPNAMKLREDEKNVNTLAEKRACSYSKLEEAQLSKTNTQLAGSSSYTQDLDLFGVSPVEIKEEVMETENAIMVDCKPCEQSSGSLQSYPEHVRLQHIEANASLDLKPCLADQTHLNYYDVAIDVKLEIEEENIINDSSGHISPAESSNTVNAAQRGATGALNELGNSTQRKTKLVKPKEEEGQTQNVVKSEIDRLDSNLQGSLTTAQGPGNVQGVPSVQKIEKKEKSVEDIHCWIKIENEDTTECSLEELEAERKENTRKCTVVKDDHLHNNVNAFIDDAHFHSKPELYQDVVGHASALMVPVEGYLKYKHKGTYKDDKPFACHVCDYKCTKKIYLKRHIENHTGEKSFVCNICDYKCRDNNNLQRHISYHSIENPFACHICDYKSKRKADLQKHYKTHNDEKPFACHICDYKCRYKTNLQRHISTYSHDKMFACHICDYKCRHKKKLHRHISTHPDEKPFECEFCNYKCSYISNLHRHLSTHSNEKPFTCDYCGYKCVRKDSLQTHIITHTDVKPFKCRFCKYKCRQRASLLRHINIHKREKPFRCPFCDYKCRQKANLQKHISIHTNEKPFACRFCDYKSAQRADLQKHNTIHANEK